MRYTLILFTLLFSITLYAQYDIKGHVLIKNDKTPLPNAVIMLTTLDSKKIIVYCTSDDNGFFRLKTKNNTDTLLITVRALNIETYKKRITPNEHNVELLINEKQQEIKEVIIKPPPIRQLGDTISYMVSNFSDSIDSSIGDVLKKMPGIKVMPNGQITYKQKAINKFYIEGLDLLQGKYNLATNNIKAENVASVQVFENHQPIKILKGVEIPDQAAINLKLKKSAIGAFFVIAQLGVGIPDELLNNELVTMRFTNKHQNMMIYKSDNTGRDITSELISFYDNISSPRFNKLNIIWAPHPNISRKHTLFNNSHFVSLNDLSLLKKDMPMNINVSYMNDVSKAKAYYKQNIIFKDKQDIVIEENIKTKESKHNLEFKNTITKNSDDFYFTNKIKCLVEGTEKNGNVISNINSRQSLNMPYFNLQNNFNLIKGQDKGKMKRLGFHISYTTSKNQLKVKPAEINTLLNKDNSLLTQQNLNYNNFSTSVNFGADKSINKIHLNYSTKLFYYANNVNSDIFIDNQKLTIDSLQNDFKRTELGTIINASLTYKFNNGMTYTIGTPVEFKRIKSYNYLNNKNKFSSNWLFYPSLSLNYEINPYFSLDGSAAFSNYIGSINDDIFGYLMTTYRNLNKNTGIQKKGNNLVFRSSFHYKNIIKALFASFNISYGNSWTNSIGKAIYKGIVGNTVSVYHPHNLYNFKLSVNGDKKIYSLKSKIYLGLYYSQNNSKFIIQNSIVRALIHSYSTNISINTQITKYIKIRGFSRFGYSKQEYIDDNKSIPSAKSLNQSLTLSIRPKEIMSFDASLNHYYNNLNVGNENIYFANMGVKYKIKRFEFMLDWTNIFNNKEVINAAANSYHSYYSIYYLRPSELLLRIKFKIL